jgi:F-type H+-transporting ATPase subunit epsilon
VDVSIVSPEEKVWQGEADMVVARSPDGEFAILRGHIPFLAALVPGRLAVVSGEDRKEFFVPGGFLEASGSRDDYHVIVLADDAEAVADMDVAEARSRYEDAQRSRQEDSDDRAAARMRVEMARVQIAESRGR